MKTRKPFVFRHRNEMPFLRMLFAFIAGILIQIYHPVALTIPVVLLIISICVLWLYTAVKKLSSGWNSRWMAGIILLLAFMASGMLITFFNTGHNHPQHFQYSIQGKSVFLAKIVKPLIEKPGSYKAEAEIIALQKNDQWISVTGQVLLYFKKDTLASGILYGDLVCFSGEPVVISPPQNPSEFNYKRFMYYHQVYYQLFLAPGNWQMLAKNEGNIIVSLAYRVRTGFINVLRRELPDQRAFAVSSALVAGFDDEVDQELISAFSNAGALHVLSVSGMHVGLIYQGLFLMLGFMIRKKWTRHILFLFLISFIWFYALLTGFSPSVARSAVMLSVVIIAKWHGGNANVFNTLVVTVLALLIYNPYYLTEVSFQLSFLAVWGIIFFHPRIFALLEPSSRIMHWAWEITSLSAAAQLMTFPLGLFYFHQFPNFFMLANLVVIPLSGLIIYLCIAVLVFSPIGPVCNLVSVLTGYLLQLLNETVLFIDHLPGSVTERVSITAWETAGLYVLMACVTVFITGRKPVFLMFSLTLAAMLITGQLYEKYQQDRQKSLIVYSIPKQQAFDLVDGNAHIFVADSQLLINQPALKFHVYNNWWNLGMKTDHIKPAEKLSVTPDHSGDIIIAGHFIFFAGKKILVADERFETRGSIFKLPAEVKLKIDYLIISGNYARSLDELLAIFDCKQIILDSSNSIRKNKSWLEQSRKLKIKCYSVLQQGAFIEKF